jgi:hypothetical protein
VTRSSNSFLLPSRKKIISGQTGFEQKLFKQWVEDLPIGNVGLTARLLYDRLHEMNRLEFPPVERFRALEMIMEPLQFVLGSLSKDLIREPLPLSKRNVLIAELVTKLDVLIIQAYKTVLDQFHHDSIAGMVLHKGCRAEALHRVLYFFGRALLTAYQLYQSPPRHIWQEIHGIYHYAVESKLHDKLLDNEEQGDVRKSTATDLYKQILLLSLAGPYRLQPGEIGKVYHALLRWVSKVRLINLAHAGPDDGLFLVDISADIAPKYRAMLGDEIIKIGWVLDTSGLAAELLKEHEELTAKSGGKEAIRPLNHPLAVGGDLLAQLMMCWGVGPQRADDRVAAGGHVTLTCGIDTLYTLFGGEELPELSQSNYRVGSLTGDKEKAVSHEPVSRSRLAADEYLVDSGSDLAAFIKHQLNKEDAEAEDAEEEDKSEKLHSYIIDETDELKGVCIKRCAIYNQSANGYHLSWSGESDTRAHVGELVGVKRDDGDGRFQVGVIRWIKSSEGNAIEFGVELFQGEMTPIIISRKKLLQNTADSWRGFLHHTTQNAETLFAPLFYAGNDDQIFIRAGTEEKPVVLGRALESSASFVQFQFDTQSPPEEAQKTPQQPGIADRVEDALDFEGIWNDIK